MDDDMSDDSYSTYSSYYSRHRSPPKTPTRPEPVTSYDIRYMPDEGSGSSKCIDLAFILDCTGSMQRFIDSTRDHIIGICDMIRGEEGLNGPDDLRVAVVNYRDHPPQDSSYVYRFHAFTSDIPSIQKYIKGLTGTLALSGARCSDSASGGGDGPEAVTAGMAATLTELEWRRQASKMVVLIADAPPHGIGEAGDQIKIGDPDGHDPLVVARCMAQHGITLFMVACEDTLSNYHHAVDFFTALCDMTSGLMLPLTTADLLAMTIVGSVLENMDMERLIQEVGTEVAQRIRQRGESMESVEEVAQELHERLLLRNEQTKHVTLPEVYVPHDNAKKNVQTWMSSQYIQDAVPKILPVPGKRLTEKFRHNNFHHYSYTPGGRLPPRRSSASVAPPTPSSPSFGSSPTKTPGSPPSAASPSRRVVSDFKAFGASSSVTGSKPLSVFGAPLLATGPGGGMFGAAGQNPGLSGPMRGLRDEEDEDEDEDDEGIRLKRKEISLDQARRIATQSVFRAGRLG